MERFARILVVLEASEQVAAARKELLEFARANGAKLTVAGTFDAPEPSLLAAIFDGRDHGEAMRAEVLDRVKTFAAPLEEAGLPVETEVVDGDPLEGVCHLSRSGRFDLVAKLAAGNDPDAPYTFGPMDRGLLRMCPLPVLIANPHKEEKPRVLVALDVNNPDYADLNHRLLRIAVAQAELFKAELHVVHAWRLVDESAFRSGAFTEISSQKLESFREAERRRRHGAIQTLLEDHRSSEVEVVEHIVEGSPPKAIAAVARSTDADLLVMGATPRRRITSIMLGDCAVAVLGSVKCSVLLVKSPDLAASLDADD
jgi:nucleotide-binding universal stress UspA family protein